MHAALISEVHRNTAKRTLRCSLGSSHAPRKACHLERKATASTLQTLARLSPNDRTIALKGLLSHPISSPLAHPRTGCSPARLRRFSSNTSARPAC